jgi:aspartyl protease family protein
MHNIIGLAGAIVIVGLIMGQFGPDLVASITDQTDARSAPAARSSAAKAATSREPAGSVVLDADRRGHFFADVDVNGVYIRTMVDTGASMLALSAEDAEKAGISPRPGDKRGRVSTANGVVEVSVVRVAEVRLQGIRVSDVDAVIMPRGALQGTLLGMSFLNKLSSMEKRGDTLVLRQ